MNDKVGSYGYVSDISASWVFGSVVGVGFRVVPRYAGVVKLRCPKHVAKNVPPHSVGQNVHISGAFRALCGGTHFVHVAKNLHFVASTNNIVPHTIVSAPLYTVHKTVYKFVFGIHICIQFCMQSCVQGCPPTCFDFCIHYADSTIGP